MIRALDNALHKPSFRRCVVTRPFTEKALVVFGDKTLGYVPVAELLHLPKFTTDAEIDLALRHGLTVREVRSRFDKETKRIAKALGLRVNDVRRARA